MKKTNSIRALKELVRQLRRKVRKQGQELHKLDETNQMLRLQAMQLAVGSDFVFLESQQPVQFDPFREIKLIVAKRFNLPVNIFDTKGNKKGDEGLARQFVMHFCSSFTTCGLREAAKHAGRADHGSVLWANSVIQNRLANPTHADSVFLVQYQDCLDQIKKMFKERHATAMVA